MDDLVYCECGEVMTPVYEKYGDPEHAIQELDHYKCSCGLTKSLEDIPDED